MRRPPTRNPHRTRVVAGIIRDQAGRVLLSRRPEGVHQGGRWEFPGGKMEAGETPPQALARELEEELGLFPRHCRPFMTVDHDYADKSVRLCFREVLSWSGRPVGREGQAVDWFEASRLGALTFPEANQPVVRALGLGDLLQVLPLNEPGWQQRLAAALAAGCALVYARGSTDPRLLRDVAGQCHDAGAMVMVATDPETFPATGADVLHLPGARAAVIDDRPEVPLLSVACHDEAELARAQALRADMVLLSPVQATASHPGAEPLGWQRFAQLATGQPFAVYAMGGLSPADLDEARIHGARGVAGIRGFG